MLFELPDELEPIIKLFMHPDSRHRLADVIESMRPSEKDAQLDQLIANLRTPVPQITAKLN